MTSVKSSEGNANNSKAPETGDLDSDGNNSDIIYPSGKLGAMTRKINEIRPYLRGEKSQETSKIVGELSSALTAKRKAFETACEDQQVLPNVLKDDLEQFILWKRGHLGVVGKFQQVVLDWLDEADHEVRSSVSITPDDSVSQISCRSRSSINEAALNTMKSEVLAKKKKLAEISALEEKERLAAENYRKLQLQLKREAEELKLKYEEEAVNKIEQQFLSNSSQNSTVSGLRPATGLHEVLEKQNELTQLLVKNQSLARLPDNSPETFDGTDLTKFRPFILSFERTIEARCNDDADRYYYLMKYTRGRPHELVVSCNSSNASAAYSEARKVLLKNYGDEFAIAHKYIEKLQKWPQIPSENAVALDEFGTFLSTCLNMMRNMGHLNQLNSLNEIRALCMKLPWDLRKNFRNAIARQRSNNLEINFEMFVNYVSDQSNILKIPLFGDIKDPKDSNQPSRESKVSRSNPHSTFSTQVANSRTTVKGKFDCACCGKNNHKLDDCFFFKKLPMAERQKLVESKGLCFGCLDSSSHMSRQCKNRLVCNLCSKTHPTSLHRSFNRSTDGVSSEVSRSVCASTVDVSTNSLDSRRVVCPAIPVALKDKNGQLVYTYMAMDNFANTSYIDSDLAEFVGLDGHACDLDLVTMDGKSTVRVKTLMNVEVFSLDGKKSKIIRRMYCKRDWPFNESDSPNVSDIESCPEFKNLKFDFISSRIGLLIGMDCPDIIKPLKIVNSTNNGPFATKHFFGWAINGPIARVSSSTLSCFRTTTRCADIVDLDCKVEKCFAGDFIDEEGKGKSFDDIVWEKKVSESLNLVNGHFEIALPFKEIESDMPNNFNQVLTRLNATARRISRNPDLLSEYKKFMETMLINDFAEEIPCDEISCIRGKSWYLTHHGVFHKQKGKFRIVFDCSLKYGGISLNDALLQGPDLTNNLLGVLLRFREGKFAISGDIEKMFYMVRVTKSDSDFLRFLWFPNSDLTKPPKHYRLKVHVFGAKSSPSCANFALRSVPRFVSVTETVSDTIHGAFYVDDLMKSVRSEDRAVDLLSDVRDALAVCGFNLTGLISNSRSVLGCFPQDCLSKSLKDVNLISDSLPYESALGVVWDVNRDTLSFRVNLPKLEFTKRAILSTIFSIYDPFFITCPVVVTGKRIFQQACFMKLSWDEQLPEKLCRRWSSWIDQVSHLKDFYIPRNYVDGVDNFTFVDLHIFCDGSEVAYGAVAYLRFTCKTAIVCRIVMSRVRQTPLNRTSLATVPRIELNSAKIAVELYLKLKSSLSLSIRETLFWSDSKTVLNYINSDSGRFQRFVSNRVAYIRSHTSTLQWLYVPGPLNPADLLSRGVSDVEKFVKCKVWTDGPDFLYNDKNEWPVPHMPESVNDSEVKKSFATKVVYITPSDRLINSTSDFQKLLYRISAFVKFVSFLSGKSFERRIRVADVEVARQSLFRYVQREWMGDIVDSLRSGHSLPKKHCLSKLNPFIDESLTLRVGGRLGNSSLAVHAKHPVLLPGKSNVVKMFIRDLHCKLGHLGRETVLSHLNLKFHVVGANSVIKDEIRKCVICRKCQGRPGEQLMAELPADRLEQGKPAFSNTGTDLFGPFFVTRGRSREKRYGVIFTCLVSRAAHLEIVHSLDTDSYINALRRFIARRGNVKLIRSDNGTNLVACNKELLACIKKWNCSQIDEACRIRNVDWKFQPANASHFGGVFEREIRTVRKILNSLLNEFSNQVTMTDELLTTLMCEVECVLNSRPLTPVTTDSDDLEALTPNHLLMLDPCGNNLPPVMYEESDCFPRRRWRQMQFLADVFWRRWRREYVPLLRARQKWVSSRRNLCVNDFVLVVDQLLPRNMWCVGRVVSVKADSHGSVRSAHVKVSKHKSGKDLKMSTTVLERPVSKLILLVDSTELT